MGDQTSSGFSYIEALIVLAIMGLMLAISIARTSSPGQILQKDRIVNEISQGLMLARSHAIKSSQVTKFQIDLKENRVSIISGHPLNFERQFDPSLKLSLVIAASQIEQEGMGAIQFYKDGSSTGGVITIRKEGGGKLLASLRIDWLTGGVEVDAEN